MQSILLRCAEADRDYLITALWQHGTVGILEEAEGLRAFFEETEGLPEILKQFAAETVETRTEALALASDFPKEDWDPIAVGQRFWIAPSWIEQPTPPGRIRLAIDNPNAFGTGRHESTQLAIEALEQYVRGNDTVADIGSGSGILSQAAWLLGAGRVISCDIHEDAIATAKAQVAARLFLGSADAIRTHSADLVVANISAKILDALWWELNRITKPNGRLILGGFIGDRQPTRFAPESLTQRGDWLCWVCRPEPAAASSNRAESHDHTLEWW